MQIDWTYTGCDQDDERELERCWEERQSALEAKLAASTAEPLEMQIGVSRESESDEWDIQAALHLSTGTVTAEAVGDRLEPALDEVVGELARGIDERPEEPWEISRRQQGLQAVLPLLERNHRGGRSDVFFAFLRPLIDSLGTHARRELDVLKSEGTISDEGISAAEVLDEVMVRAWERFNRRPEKGTVEMWLLGLVHEVLEDIARDRPLQSLDEERPEPVPEGEDASRDAWTEQATYPETIELGELLPGHPGIDSWDRLDIEAKQTGLAQLLAKLPAEQRHAMVLSAVEGFPSKEIADFLDRPLEQVEADIASARNTLWNEFNVNEYLPDVEEDFEERGGRDTARRRR